MRQEHKNLNSLQILALTFFVSYYYIGSFLSELGIQQIFISLFCILPFILDKKNTDYSAGIKVNLSIKLYLVFLIASAFTLIYSLDIVRGIAILVNYFLIFIYFLGLLNKNYFQILNVFLIVNSIWLVIIYINLAKLFFDYTTVNNRFGYTIGEIELNPNNLAALIAILILISFCNYLHIKVISMKAFYFILSVFYIFLLIETQSRTAMYALILGGCYLGLRTFKNYISLFVFSFSMSAFLFILLLQVNANEISRFLKIDLNGRDDIWAIAFNFLNETYYNFILGFGMGSAEQLIGSKYLDKVSIGADGIARANPHNLYIETLLNSGIIITLVLFALLFQSLFINIKKMRLLRINKVEIFVLIFPILIICTSFASNPLRSFYMPLILGVFFVILSDYYKGRQEL